MKPTGNNRLDLARIAALEELLMYDNASHHQRELWYSEMWMLTRAITQPRTTYFNSLQAA